MKVLVINAGSSSLKYQLIDMNDESVICKGLVERIGMSNARLEHKLDDKKYEYTSEILNHTMALEQVIKELLNSDHPSIKNINEIEGVGHRVLHSGEDFKDSVLITDATLKIIEKNIPLGVLHMPANVACIKACRELLDVPMVAVFDTAFHMSMPKYAYMYGIKYEDYRQFHIRRYGFHGTSHKYVSQEATKLLNDSKKNRIITCHLGNGSSIAAIANGKVIDTSMGFTPLEGLIMGTRSGDIDAAAAIHLMEQKNLTSKELLNYLNKESGFLGVSGVSSDSRDLYVAAKSGNERAQLALDIFAYRVKKYIGAYAAAMNGVDCIVFTGGIGENAEETRAQILSNLTYLGVKVDKEVNIKENRKLADISAKDSKVKIYIIPTNEELMIARDTVKLSNI